MGLEVQRDVLGRSSWMKRGGRGGRGVSRKRSCCGSGLFFSRRERLDESFPCRTFKWSEAVFSRRQRAGCALVTSLPNMEFPMEYAKPWEREEEDEQEEEQNEDRLSDARVSAGPTTKTGKCSPLPALERLSGTSQLSRVPKCCCRTKRWRGPA